jgi:ammonia channel protein AmtB
MCRLIVSDETRTRIARATAAFAGLIYAFILTYILVILIDKIIDPLVTEEEYAGSGISRHGKRA